jgi:hypothetical protein
MDKGGGRNTCMSMENSAMKLSTVARVRYTIEDGNIDFYHRLLCDALIFISFYPHAYMY